MVALAGAGGPSASVDPLSVYEAMSSKIPHQLVILAYFLGNESAR
jgi:hypothetical protein